MMLAQALSGESTAIWSGVGVVAIGIIGAFGKVISDWQKGKREARLDAERESRSAYFEAEKTAFLKRIADSNDRTLITLTEIRIGQANSL